MRVMSEMSGSLFPATKYIAAHVNMMETFKPGRAPERGAGMRRVVNATNVAKMRGMMILVM